MSETSSIENGNEGNVRRRVILASSGVYGWYATSIEYDLDSQKFFNCESRACMVDDADTWEREEIISPTEALSLLEKNFPDNIDEIEFVKTKCE